MACALLLLHDSCSRPAPQHRRPRNEKNERRGIRGPRVGFLRWLPAGYPAGTGLPRGCRGRPGWQPRKGRAWSSLATYRPETRTPLMASATAAKVEQLADYFV